MKFDGVGFWLSSPVYGGGVGSIANQTRRRKGDCACGSPVRLAHKSSLDTSPASGEDKEVHHEL